jgi:AbiV family abortive infection protein
MENKTFLNISKEECSIVYKKIIDNSNNKWNSCKSIAETKEYGTAISLAIISIEELVKALIVFFDGHGFEFRKIKGIKSIFANHQLRYFIAFIMFVMGLMGEELIKFIQKFHDNPEEMTKTMERMTSDEKFLNQIGFRYLLRKMVLVKNEFDWFSKVDLFRQEGFYSDYENQLKTPISINEEDYNQMVLRLEKVRTVGKELISSFESTNVEAQKNLERLRMHFKDKEIYDKISNVLTTTRQSKTTPFELIKKNISSSRKIRMIPPIGNS